MNFAAIWTGVGIVGVLYLLNLTSKFSAYFEAKAEKLDAETELIEFEISENERDLEEEEVELNRLKTRVERQAKTINDTIELLAEIVRFMPDEGDFIDETPEPVAEVIPAEPASEVTGTVSVEQTAPAAEVATDASSTVSASQDGSGSGSQSA